MWYRENMQKKLIFKCTKANIYKKTNNCIPYSSYIEVYSCSDSLLYGINDYETLYTIAILSSL